MPIREAVSAVFVFEDQLFMVKRQPYLLAFPGYHAFPGGKIDREDSDAPLEAAGFKHLNPLKVRALARELSEELEFDLFQAVDEGLVTQISELASATAPPFSPTRFRNFFFRIDVKRKPDFVVDTEEAAFAEWITPQETMARYDTGDLLAVPPIFRMLKALTEAPQTSYIEDIDFIYNSETEQPCWEVFAGFYQIPVPSNTLPPATATNAFVIGDTLIDPSPKDAQHLAYLENTLDRFDLKKIMLTHNHGDHHQFADSIARNRNLPIWCSADTHMRISRSNPNFWEGIVHKPLQDGDVLTQWLGEDVIIHAVPGHDEGQLALAPRSLKWFIVGDLIQGIGTVVIAGEEGNMLKYFRSLEKVIDLDPAVIIPSHGTAMGSTHRLQETLKHRRVREDQVLQYHRQGLMPQEILEKVYVGLDPGLTPFAFANVQSHLDKLREEGRLEPA